MTDEELNLSDDEINEQILEIMSGDEDRIITAAPLLGLYGGPRAANKLIPLLRNKQDIIVDYTAFCLGKMGKNATVAIPELKSLLLHKNEKVRFSASTAIELINA